MWMTAREKPVFAGTGGSKRVLEVVLEPPQRNEIVVQDSEGCFVEFDVGD